MVRCQALAGAVAHLAPDSHITFAMESGAEFVSGFPVTGPSLTAADVLVADVRGESVSRRDLDAFPGLVVVIDDGSDRRLAADLAFYPPVPQVQRLDWTGFTGDWYAGFDWVVLRQAFASVEERVAESPSGQEAPTVLVTMGGSDPFGLTAATLDELGRHPVPEATYHVVLGPAYEGPYLSALTSGLDVRYYRAPTDLQALMGRATVAIASFGMTAYELAAMGTPAIYLSISEDHAESASACEAAGLGVSAGMDPSAVPEALGALLSNPERRAQMGAQARSRVDGRGAERIARLMLDRA